LDFELHRCRACGAETFAAFVGRRGGFINSVISCWTTISVRLTVFS
jgi:hypothetical protein